MHHSVGHDPGHPHKDVIGCPASRRRNRNWRVIRACPSGTKAHSPNCVPYKWRLTAPASTGFMRAGRANANYSSASSPVLMATAAINCRLRRLSPWFKALSFLHSCSRDRPQQSPRRSGRARSSLDAARPRRTYCYRTVADGRSPGVGSESTHARCGASEAVCRPAASGMAVYVPATSVAPHPPIPTVPGNWGISAAWRPGAPARSAAGCASGCD
jgi:hypothetical protein